MAKSKVVKLFLMDGTPTGRIKCSLSNWTGVAYKIPKTMLDKCADIGYLKNSGIYFLFGTDTNYEDAVYIGQARTRKNGNGVLGRILEPHNSIDWNEAVIFTTTNDSLGPTEISYLESTFCKLSIEAKRYHVKNGNDPNLGYPTEETQSEMDEFIEYAKIVIGSLGHKVLEPFITLHSEIDEDEPILFMKYKDAEARGMRTAEGFIILSGSTINPTFTGSCPEGVINARKKYADSIKDNKLTTDIPMSSPSAAAGFIGGASLSGNALWHDADGKTLKQIDNEE